MMRRQFAAFDRGDHAAASAYKRRGAQLRRAYRKLGDAIAFRQPLGHGHGTYDPRTGGYYTGT